MQATIAPFVFDLMNCKALPYLLHLCVFASIALMQQLFLFLLLLLLFICCRFFPSLSLLLFLCLSCILLRFYYNFNAYNLNYCNVDFDHQFHNFLPFRCGSLTPSPSSSACVGNLLCLPILKSINIVSVIAIN